MWTLRLSDLQDILHKNGIYYLDDFDLKLLRRHFTDYFDDDDQVYYAFIRAHVYYAVHGRWHPNWTDKLGPADRRYFNLFECLIEAFECEKIEDPVRRFTYLMGVHIRKTDPEMVKDRT